MSHQADTATIDRVMRILAAGGRRVSSERQARWSEWIARANAGGLDVGIVAEPHALLGTRLRICADRGERRLWGVASSRLTRKLESWSSWFAALRMICSQIDQSSASLLVFEGTTADIYATRAAELFGCSVVRASVSAAGKCFETWMDGMSGVSPREVAINEMQLSPPLELATPAPAVWATSDRDRCLAALSHHLVALYVRRGGNIEQLLKLRLQLTRHPNATRLVIGPNLTRARVRDDLLSAGAVGWYLCSNSAHDSTGDASHPRKRSNRPGSVAGKPHAAAVESPVPFADVESEWEYLTHCTRRRRGPWPDQTRDDYVDDLLLDRDTDRSPFAALRRIICQKCLFASAQLIRGSAPVVSFTAVSLSELNRLRVFRPHRGTWDFEPYGIGIRRDWLRKRATRPVRYASEQEWNELSEQDRPYFQKHASLTRAGAVWDWTAEQEWRHLGDLDLSELGSSDAFVLVPTTAEQETLSTVSPWPVEILPPMAVV